MCVCIYVCTDNKGGEKREREKEKRNVRQRETNYASNREKTERCHGPLLGDPWKRYSLCEH